MPLKGGLRPHTQLAVVGRNLTPLEEVDLRGQGVQAGVHEELQGPLLHVEHVGFPDHVSFL